jgi:sialate O-acetylesterase
VCAIEAHANVKLAPIFGDNMVLQREMPVPIWGTASAGEEVMVTFAGQSKSTKADDKGNWQVKLDALKAGGPFELIVAGKNKVTFSNVLVGEVWVCSGQSNMEWALKQTEKADDEIAASANDKLRLNNSGKWQITGPDSSGTFSGTGYYFGKALQKALGIPVGLVNRSVGGTSARSWTSKSAILEEPAMGPYVESILGKDAKGGSGNLYAGLIRPLQPMAIRGVVWYQGESDASRPQEYAQLIQTMIRSWRKDWGQGDFPFIYVHLGAIGAAPRIPQDIGWGPIREAQDAALKLPNTGVAEFFDSDSDLHPRKKKLAGDRLALAARALAYGEKIVHSGPVLDRIEKSGDALIVHFKSVGGGLVNKGDQVRGFAIAGKDGQFHWADAEIKGDTVRLTSKAVPAPEFVRYGYASNPRATLYNREDLPALPFRTDQAVIEPPAKKGQTK